MESSPSIIRQAAAKFSAGAFQEAHQLYQQAAELLGSENVKINLWLCEQRMGKTVTCATSSAASLSAPVRPQQATADELARQLAETQAQLESYYSRYQQLKYQAMDTQ